MILSKPYDTENILQKSLQNAIKKMIESFKKTLHLKILVYQLDINKQMLYESLMQDNKLPADFDINQKTFNKHYE